MAKTKQTGSANAGPNNARNSVLARLKKDNPDAEIISKSAFGELKDWISTGNYALNCQISGSIYKGIPRNRITGISGPSGTGKTFLALNIAREAQKLDYHVLYFDTEFAIDIDTVKKFSIDVDNFTLIPEDIIHNVKNQIVGIYSEIKDLISSKKDPGKFIIVIDSIGNLKTAKEDNDSKAGESKRDMTRPGEIKSLFRTITVDSGKLGIPIILVNHTYKDTTAYVPSNVIAGGSGAQYNPSVNIILTKAKLKEETKESKGAGLAQTGIVVTSKLEKSRFTRPITIKFHIDFFKGMNKYVYLENYIDWETCGIQRGTLKKAVTMKPVLDENGEQVIYRGKPKFEEVESDQPEFKADDSAKTWAVRHLGRAVKGSELFSRNVFTDEVLEALDKKMASIFLLPEAISEDEFTSMDDDLEALGFDNSDDDSDENDGDE